MLCYCAVVLLLKCFTCRRSIKASWSVSPWKPGTGSELANTSQKKTTVEYNYITPQASKSVKKGLSVGQNTWYGKKCEWVCINEHFRNFLYSHSHWITSKLNCWIAPILICLSSVSRSICISDVDRCLQADIQAVWATLPYRENWWRGGRTKTVVKGESMLKEKKKLKWGIYRKD